MKHESQRGYFAYELYKQMEKDENIFLLLGDLGYAVFDRHRESFPNRVINCGAAEQTMMGMAVGLALEGKIPVVYSITPFLLYRPFETIRTYIDHEKIPVKMVGSGRGSDYEHDGFSHFAGDDMAILAPLFNIDTHWPAKKEDITEEFVHSILYDSFPSYLNLRR